MEEKTKSYSGVFIIYPEKEETIDQAKNVVKSIINNHSGKIVDEKPAGKRTLPYPIKKKNEGIYYELVFTALPSSIEKIKRLFDIDPNIMRTLITGMK